MPRTTRALPAPSSLRAHLLNGGNGTPRADAAPADRLARIEALLLSIEQTLAVQFQRIADIQLQLDRAIADRPLTARR